MQVVDMSRVDRFVRCGTTSADSGRRTQLLEVCVKIRSAQGFAIIDLLFVCAIIGIISGIALPKLVMARGSAFAASAIASMRTINSAQLTFAITCGTGFYAPNLTSLAKVPAGSLDGYIK